MTMVAAGDELEVRGPIGLFFVWPGDRPALLVGGGAGRMTHDDLAPLVRAEQDVYVCGSPARRRGHRVPPGGRCSGRGDPGGAVRPFGLSPVTHRPPRHPFEANGYDTFR